MFVSRSVALLAAVALTAACQSSQTQVMSDSVREQVSNEIRAAADAVVNGFNKNDAAPYLEQLSHIQSYAENQMTYPSPDSVRGAVHQFMASGASVDIEWRGEPRVVVLGPGLGVFSSAMRETVTDVNGGTSIQDGVWTAVYQRIDGSWKIVAAHESYAPAQGAESM